MERPIFNIKTWIPPTDQDETQGQPFCINALNFDFIKFKDTITFYY